MATAIAVQVTTVHVQPDEAEFAHEIGDTVFLGGYPGLPFKVTGRIVEETDEGEVVAYRVRGHQHGQTYTHVVEAGEMEPEDTPAALPPADIDTTQADPPFADFGLTAAEREKVLQDCAGL